MKVMAYYRVSGKSQVDGDGFPRQQAAVSNWAEANGATVVREYREKGVTGEADWDTRPAFEEMLGDILGNGVRMIVIENLTRLARNFVVQDSILTFLASRGISLISVDTNSNVTEDIKADPMKRAIVQIQAVFSELEKRMIVRKLKAARDRKKQEDPTWTSGRKPFGHRPGEQATIDRMHELARKRPRPSNAQIGQQLDEEGRATRTGKPWAAETVRKILQRKERSK